MRLLKRVLTKLAAALLVGYVMLALALASLSRRILFPVPPTQAMGRLPPGVVHVPNCGAAKVPCLYLAAAEGQPTVVFFHGNGDQLANASWLALHLQEKGLGLLAVEYPGYSGAPGHPSERSLFAAAHGALEYLRDVQHVPNERTVLFGQSLGTGVATELAQRGVGARLILVSPFTSIADVAQRVFPFLPARWLVWDRFDSLSKAARVHQPTLVLHGTDDEVVPFDLGQRLSGAMAGATFVPIAGAHHNDILDQPGVMDAIASFALDGQAPLANRNAQATPR